MNLKIILFALHRKKMGGKYYLFLQIEMYEVLAFFYVSKFSSLFICNLAIGYKFEFLNSISNMD